jgi:predicted site-specific integrase-resolvase
MTKFPKLMASGDVRQCLGVSYQYIDKLVDEGKLRCQRTSSGRIFLAEDVMKFKRERMKRAKNDPRIKLR